MLRKHHSRTVTILSLRQEDDSLWWLSMIIDIQSQQRAVEVYSYKDNAFSEQQLIQMHVSDSLAPLSRVWCTGHRPFAAMRYSVYPTALRIICNMNHVHPCKWILGERLLTRGLKPGLLGVPLVHSIQIDNYRHTEAAATHFPLSSPSYLAYCSACVVE